METEYDQQALQRDQIKKEIAYWNEVLQKSEKYERLSQDADFKSVISDLEDTAKAHQIQIEIGLESLSQLPIHASPSEPNTLADVQHAIFVHQIKKEYVDSAIKRPKEILELAKTARKNIPELEDQLKNLREE